MTKILGFAPDADPTTPGLLVFEAANIIPTESGVAGAPSFTDQATDLSADCRGMASLEDLAGTERLFAGTASDIFELAGGSWGSAGRVGGYTLGASDRWSFCEFFDERIAATPSAVIQRATTGDFANVAGSPQAKIVTAAAGFVVAFNTSTNEDEWYCSAYLDSTDWAVSVATQCTSGRLTGGSGPITAALKFGDDIVAYKEKSMYVGTYVGAPEVWRWRQVSTEVGCVGMDAICDTPKGHIFAAADGIYLFDGTTPRRLGDGVINSYFTKNRNAAFAGNTICIYDHKRALVWIFYLHKDDTGTDDRPSRALVYRPSNGKWGVVLNILGVTTAPTVGVGGVYEYKASGTYRLGIIDNDENYLLDGSHGASIVLGWFVGDFMRQSVLDAVYAQFYTNTSTVTATGLSGTAPTTDVSATVGITSSLSGAKFDMRQSNQWHWVRLNFSGGEYELIGLDYKLIPAGRR